ncbi:hypothetical protein ACKI2N_020655 [Cupriavidus sp. 30B13]|uniref:hypothetical protein n=1 Tax=Cupriavidus sp. 30B13 TaxID=3384241 RepID=UPI003B9014B1
MTRPFRPAPALLACALPLALLAACQQAATPSERNFGAALSKHFETHGELCVGRHEWPVDVPDTPAATGLRDGIQMPALEQAGLVAHTAAEMTLHHQDGSSETVKARRYALTDKGRAYFHDKPQTSAATADAAKADLCYGKVTLARVLDWEPPRSGQGTPPHQVTTVRYTYVIDAAPWTREPAVQKAFPVLARVVNGSGTMPLTQTLTLTDAGWAVQ